MSYEVNQESATLPAAKRDNKSSTPFLESVLTLLIWESGRIQKGKKIPEECTIHA